MTRRMLRKAAAAKCTALSLFAVTPMLFAGCADAPKPPPAGGEVSSRPASISISQLLKRPAEYYTDDGPDGAPPVDLDRIADAVPRAEPLHASANEPYSVFGRDYVPMKAPGIYKRQGTASWYGRKYHGQRTAGGEVYDMYAMSASHPTLPIPSYARVTNLANRASVVVRINDRGPFASGRIMDVSFAAAHRLGFVQSGSAQVEVESILVSEPGTIVAAPAGSITPAAPAATATSAAPGRPAAETVQAPAAEPAIPLSAERSGIFLQLGAFSVRPNAENFQARIAKQLEALATPVTIEQRGTLFRVQLGPYRDRAAATAAADRVRGLIDIKPIVVAR